MHFYTLNDDGFVEPRHFVPMTKDPSQIRPSRVTDARKAKKEKQEIWYPSVTTVMNVLDKPALLNWKIDQHLETVLENWGIKKIKAATELKLDAAPKAGTDIHNVLEEFIGLGKEPADPVELKICQNVKEALADMCGKQDWQCEQYFIDSKYGYAGCADLVSENWIIDYKSKQTADKFKPGKMVWNEHYMQLAAYSHGILGNFVSCANIFVCLENGEIDFHVHSGLEIELGWYNFVDCISLYQRNTYDPKGAN